MPTRRDLEARLGSPSDVLGPRLAVADDGPERGCRMATMHTGTGLQVTINLDRGMDARDAWWAGIPISLSSPAGDTGESDLLRTWPGGLLLTCGLRNVGPAEDVHPLHGRISGMSARDVLVRCEWEGDDLVSTVGGTVREAALFGEHLELRRTWRTVFGRNQIWLRDEIRNAGFAPERVFVLYHSNVGYPLIDEGSTITIDSSVQARDAEGAKALDSWTTFPAPSPGVPEQVLFHDVRQGADGWCRAGVTSPGGIDFEIAWRKDQLGSFAQWRSPMSGSYALGLEPGNCLPLGRTAETEAGRGDVLEPGETKVVDVVYTLR